MESLKKSKVAIIGLGNIGKTVATNLVKGNREIFIADKTFTKAEELAQKLGSLAKPLEVLDAIKHADIIIMAVWFSTIKEFFTLYATELEGKIVVDPSNPIAPAENGGFKKTIGENESSGELLAGLLPKNTKIAKALGSLGAATLSSAAFGEPRSVEFYASDDASINSEIETLIADNGFEPLLIGGIKQSIRIEVFGDLHEFGALGKTVTLQEAKSLLSAKTINN